MCFFLCVAGEININRLGSCNSEEFSCNNKRGGEKNNNSDTSVITTRQSQSLHDDI